jgi:enamine deaminase RidA (YjgF/YER057c/UK114 family)
MTSTATATIGTVNPWTWQDAFGYAQATLVGGQHRILYLAGQCSMDADGNPVHVGDMAAQAAQAMDNLQTVLAAAGLSLADVVRYDVYTTDLEAYLRSGAEQVAGRFAAAGRLPAGGICTQVVALAIPVLLVEIVATACA